MIKYKSDYSKDLQIILEKLNASKTDMQMGSSFMFGIPSYEIGIPIIPETRIFISECDESGCRDEHNMLLIFGRGKDMWFRFRCSIELLLNLDI